MRYVARPFAALALALALGGAASAGPPDPFLGSWRSIDAVDGSSQTLQFGGSGDTRRATLFDDFATGCGPENESAATARGTATFTSATSVEVEYLLHCLRTGERKTISGVPYEYDAANDTLTDHDGTVWSRPGA